MNSGADLSKCGTYRYKLWRIWDDEKPDALFIMLNPSTADADLDNPTIRRCMSFARSWGMGGLQVVNLFALRATEPMKLYRASDPIGPQNDETILATAAQQSVREGVIVCAWGQHGTLHGRGEIVRLMLRDAGLKLNMLRATKSGHPGHPLYVPGATQPVPFGTAA